MRDDADHQYHAAEQVHQQVTQAGPIGALRAGRPDHDGRTERHDLPKHEYRQQIAGKGHTDRRAGVDERRGQFGGGRLAMSIQPPGEGHDREHRGEQPALGRRAHRLERVVEKGQLQRSVCGQTPHRRQRECGQAEQYQ